MDLVMEMVSEALVK